MIWQETGFIQRERRVTGTRFAQALVLGGLAQPDATRKQCHHQAIQAGITVSLQAGEIPSFCGVGGIGVFRYAGFTDHTSLR
jgi:hypothetical protein